MWVPIYLYVYNWCKVFKGARRLLGALGTGVKAVVICPIWVLGFELGLSSRVAIACSRCAIFRTRISKFWLKWNLTCGNYINRAMHCQHLSLYHLTFFLKGGQKTKQLPRHPCTIDFKWIFHSLHLSTSMWQTLKNKEIWVAWFYLFMSPAGDYKHI